MPVTINEFEVMVDPNQQPQREEQPAQPGGAPRLTPSDLIDLLRRQAERMARLRAY